MNVSFEREDGTLLCYGTLETLPPIGAIIDIPFKHYMEVVSIEISLHLENSHGYFENAQYHVYLAPLGEGE